MFTTHGRCNLGEGAKFGVVAGSLTIGTMYSITIGSMYGIFPYIWLIFMVNVKKYTIHCHTWILWDRYAYKWLVDFYGTLPKTNSSPLKSDRNPKGKDRLPTIIFQGRSVKLQGCSDHHQAFMSPIPSNWRNPISNCDILRTYILHVCTVNKTNPTFSNTDFYPTWDTLGSYK